MEINGQDLKTFINEVFTHLHTYPEVSWEEYETTQYIKKLLDPLNCTLKTFDDMPGLIAEVGKGKPVVALRADIDALWQEVDGEFRANHSCGHDAHMTIVLGTLLSLVKEGVPNKGTFRFIFQPAEEKGTGALALVDKGIVNDVDYLYGLHLRPVQELRHGQLSPAIQHGAARFINGEIRGEDAHGARPHLTANAIQVGSEFFQHLNNIQIDPMIPYSVKMTSFHAGGESSNIIPGNATFSIDMRAQTNETMELLQEKVEDIGRMLSDYHGVEINLETVSTVAAAVLNEEAILLMQGAIIDVVGESQLVPIITTTGGDDFHFYKIKRPQLKATMLGIGCDLQPGLHHPEMTFKHEAMEQAVKVLVKVMKKTVETA